MNPDTPAVELPPPPIDPRRLTFTVAALAAIGPFAIDAYLPSFEDIGHSLNASALQVQQTLSIYMFFLGFMNLWHGALADALGRRPVLLGSMLLFCAASIGAACSSSIEQLWFWRALQGAAGGAGMAVGRAVVRDVYSGAQAQRILAQVMMAFSLAPAVAPVLGGQVTVHAGWRGVFALLALMSALQALLVWRVLPETLPPGRRQSLRPRQLLAGYRSVLEQPGFWRLSGALTLSFLAFFVYVLAAPTYMRQVLGLGPTGFAWLFVPAMLGTLCGGFMSSVVAGHRPLGWAVRAGFVLMGLAAAANLALALWQPGTLPWAVVPLFFYACGLGLVMSAVQVLLMDLQPLRAGLVSSCQAFVQSVTNGLASALLVPLLWDSAAAMAVCMGVLLVLAAACQVMQVRLSRRTLARADQAL